MPREGVLVHRIYERLNRDQLERIHDASMEILNLPGDEQPLYIMPVGKR